VDNLELDSSPLWWINLIALLYCTAAIPILSIVYGINYGKYNQTILLLCIIGLTVFLISQIIFLLFNNQAKERIQNAERQRCIEILKNEKTKKEDEDYKTYYQKHRDLAIDRVITKLAEKVD
jgi:mannitol-specific phosphotransferase system IIBC component